MRNGVRFRIVQNSISGLSVDVLSGAKQLTAVVEDFFKILLYFLHFRVLI